LELLLLPWNIWVKMIRDLSQTAPLAGLVAYARDSDIMHPIGGISKLGAFFWRQGDFFTFLGHHIQQN